MSYCVYMHTCPNGKRYVGVTMKDTKTRWAKGSGYKNQAFGAGIEEAGGWENIRHEILMDGLSRLEADYWERFFISMFRTVDPKYGYNADPGGDIPKTQEERDGIKKFYSRSVINLDTGRIFENVFEAEAATRGYAFPNGICDSCLSMDSPYHGLHWAFADDEVKQQWYALQKARGTLYHGKCKKVVNLDTSEVFPNIHVAGMHYDITPFAIQANINGKTKTAAGYHWAWL